jgi:hypothetical protein
MIGLCDSIGPILRTPQSRPPHFRTICLNSLDPLSYLRLLFPSWSFIQRDLQSFVTSLPINVWHLSKGNHQNRVKSCSFHQYSSGIVSAMVGWSPAPWISLPQSPFIVERFMLHEIIHEIHSTTWQKHISPSVQWFLSFYNCYIRRIDPDHFRFKLGQKRAFRMEFESKMISNEPPIRHKNILQ